MGPISLLIKITYVMDTYRHALGERAIKLINFWGPKSGIRPKEKSLASALKNRCDYGAVCEWVNDSGVGGYPRHAVFLWKKESIQDKNKTE